MSNEGWRTLLPIEWADCIIHNQPIGVLSQETVKKESLVISQKTQTIYSSVYELNKSATEWNYFDFKKI